MSGTSHGIDVSAYQGVQDWETLTRGGLTFAFAKASEGQHSRDTRFDTHMAGIIRAGLIPGAYHYGWPSQGPIAEAANYVAAVKPYARRGFVHVLDLERRSDGANYAGSSHAQIRVWAGTWIAAVAAAFPGQRVGIYTSGDDITSGHLPANAAFLWYPAYPSGAMTYAQAEAHARPAPSGRQPLFWQFTSTPIDRSIAYLSPAALRAWALGTSTPEDDMPLTDAEIDKIADRTATRTMGYPLPSPTAPEGTDPDRSAGTYIRYSDAHHAQVMARLGALEGVVTKLVTAVAVGGGLTAAEITAAAKVGADAALAELGDALTN